MIYLFKNPCITNKIASSAISQQVSSKHPPVTLLDQDQTVTSTVIPVTLPDPASLTYPPSIPDQPDFSTDPPVILPNQQEPSTDPQISSHDQVSITDLQVVLPDQPASSTNLPFTLPDTPASSTDPPGNRSHKWIILAVLIVLVAMVTAYYYNPTNSRTLQESGWKVKDTPLLPERRL